MELNNIFINQEDVLGFESVDILEPLQFNWLKFRDFMNLEIEEQGFILKPLLRHSSITYITSNTGSLKTFFSLGLCKSILKNESFGDWNTETDCNIMYIDSELPLSLLLERSSMMDLNKEQYEKFSILSKSTCNDYQRPLFNLLNPDFQDYIKNKCINENIKLVIFDNLSTMCNGMKENEKYSVDTISQYFLELRHSGISSIVVHHNGKNGHYRGSSSMMDSADVHISIKRPDKNKNIIDISFEKFRYETDESVTGVKRFGMILHEGIIKWTLLKGGNFERDKRVLICICNKKIQEDIAIQENISRSLVSRIFTSNIDQGYFTNDKYFTNKGKKYYGVHDVN